jgi:hypothetical protein
VHTERVCGELREGVHISATQHQYETTPPPTHTQHRLLPPPTPHPIPHRSCTAFISRPRTPHPAIPLPAPHLHPANSTHLDALPAPLSAPRTPQNPSCPPSRPPPPTLMRFMRSVKPSLKENLSALPITLLAGSLLSSLYLAQDRECSRRLTSSSGRLRRCWTSP